MTIGNFPMGRLLKKAIGNTLKVFPISFFIEFDEEFE